MNEPSEFDGGPAFPRPAVLMADDGEWDEGHNGMYLRDYFVAKAMAAIIANMPDIETREGYQDGLAVAAYEIADAMLKARVI